jgi:Tfp pilus assembly protein PilN
VPIPQNVRAVNLLPPDMRGASKATAELGARPEATGGAGPFVVLGVLAACVAGATGYVLTNNTIKQRQADLAAVTASQQALQGKVAELKPFADFDAATNSRVATVRDLAGSRFDWEQVLRDVSRAIPQDVALKTLSGNVSTDTGGAGGSGSLRGAISAPAVTLTGCAPGQTQVARLMARLRGVDGVTRVSLSKSDVQKVDGGTNATGTAIERRNAAPCGSGIRPDFELVMFFEKATAAVQAPSAQPPAAGAQPGATATATPAAGGTATPTPSATPGNTTTASTSTGSTP